MAALIPGGAEQPVRVLDVGGGYGVVASAVLDARPRATLVLQDYSDAMLTEGRARLATYGDRVEFCRSDLMDPGWARDLGGPFDAVVSALAIHNLSDPAVIARVYRDVFSLLRPGGCFFNSDLFFPSGPLLADLYEQASVDDPDWEARVGRADLVDQLRWLREAGFAEVDCISKELYRGLLCAIRDPHL
jgi:tRNA (cmo5U34)-methyltransferase